jgi:hypothetical protein
MAYATRQHAQIFIWHWLPKALSPKEDKKPPTATFPKIALHRWYHQPHLQTSDARPGGESEKISSETNYTFATIMFSILADAMTEVEYWKVPGPSAFSSVDHGFGVDAKVFRAIIVLKA